MPDPGPTSELKTTWREWALGLASYAIQGAATALGTLMAAPDVFNINSELGLKKFGMVAGFNALLGVFLYLKLYPLPGVKGQLKL